MINQRSRPGAHNNATHRKLDDLAIAIATLGQAYDGMEGAEEAYIDGELTLRLLASLDNAERLLSLGAPESIVLRALDRLQRELLEAARSLAPSRCH